MHGSMDIVDVPFDDIGTFDSHRHLSELTWQYILKVNTLYSYTFSQHPVL